MPETRSTHDFDQKHVLVNYYGVQHHVVQSALRGETLLREKTAYVTKLKRQCKKWIKTDVFVVFDH